jgi:hypothetical protein
MPEEAPMGADQRVIVQPTMTRWLSRGRSEIVRGLGGGFDQAHPFSTRSSTIP